MNIENKNLEEIEIIFKNQIKIPKNKPMKQFFICPVGLVGAGKTTVMKPLSERLDLVRLSSDELRKILKESGKGYEYIKDVGFSIAKQFISEGYSIGFDMDCGNPTTKEFVEKLAKENNAKIFWIYINPPEEFIINKLKNYKHTWLFKDSDQAIENYFNQKKKREEENTKFDFFFEFDTSRNDLSEQINNCIEKIKQDLEK